MKNLTCRPVGLRRIPVYDASAVLGTPFTVLLTDAVDEKYDVETGEALGVVIPKHNELLAAVAMLRVSHERKLSGDDVKFLRKALHLKAREFAEENCMTPETLSRIENGKQAISPAMEKLVRLYTWVGLFPHGVGVRNEFLKLSRMEIVAVSADLEPLTFDLCLAAVSQEHIPEDSQVYSALRSA